MAELTEVQEDDEPQQIVKKSQRKPWQINTLDNIAEFIGFELEE
ncbi:hypothetical protein [Lactococcus lactis]|nr:hypothetical protein [Lactococcus lactis]